MGFREARMKAGMTQIAVANAVGVSTAAVSLWENGHSIPRGAKLVKIAHLYGCSIDDLLSSVADPVSDKTDYE